MDYIERIKKIKSERKITNEKLSELTGIPLGTLSKIMAGISDSPKLSNMVLIASALGCSLDYLVSGTPENTNNYTLTDDEISLIEDYRQLDSFGRDLVSVVAQKELDRVGMISEQKSSKKKTAEKPKEKKATVIPFAPSFAPASAPAVESIARRPIPIYDLPVSAGPGVYLDDSSADVINIPKNEKTNAASYALRISGNSMEPKYHDGDVLLVEDAETVEIGELGIFVLDGNGYFKIYGGDRLISMNKIYGDILARSSTCKRRWNRLV